MTFAKFGGENGRPVYINPTAVKSVIELNDRLCMVQLDAQLMINIPLPVHVVVSDLEKAAGNGK
ncbi:hypothetical protein IVB12_06345 [Bradyrhizobium sp. 179]|uniref:hypothetical protein n=1 Tax=Bradyrhizobium sp. 179 TaxID=2782648 RepID=UPI001FF95511|nr:hypothetical protein [Bradyrhizobium sp. 179]MCK1541609.1 hypothetical protein [Bradyrhizobium sp. 179]